MKEPKNFKKKYLHDGFIEDSEKPIHHRDGSISWYKKRTDLKI